MPRDMQAFSDVMVLAIKAALAPVQERVAALEQSNRELHTRLVEALTLRDRVTTIETKAAVPQPEPVAVDLTPVLERVSAVEARVLTLGDVRDRLVTIETKSAAPVIAPLESVPVGLTSADVELAIRNHVDPLAKQAAAISERVAVVEVRQPIPGPAGPAGKDGTNGLNGKDGTDGLGFDDLIAEQTDERSFTIKAQRGDRIKEIGRARFPLQIQRGVYVEGKSYEHGDLVTWGGSQWFCETETKTKPGEGKDWTLVVKRGRDGRDGKDAVTTPVVSVR